MSVRSVVYRQWRPIAVGAVLGAVEAFAINKVSADQPKWWWWIVVVAALVGVLGCALWGLLAERAVRRRASMVEVSQSDVGVVQQGGSGAGTAQQSVVGQGQNVNIKADNNSVAAY